MLTAREAKARKIELKREKAKRAAEGSLEAFSKQAWDIVEPGRPFVPGWHIGAIAEHLKAVTDREIRNLIINVPPRHSKSSFVSVFWPAWVWGPYGRPFEDWLFGSYSPKLSTRDSVKCRRILESYWYRMLWGDVFAPNDSNIPDSLMRSDQNEKMRYQNIFSGTRIATSPGGTGTGDGGDIICVDDPHKVKVIESQLQRSAVCNWWDDEMSSRGNDPETVCRVIIMQRVHGVDLCGHVNEKYGGMYERLVLPFEFEPKVQVDFSCTWFKDPRTKEGEILWPERYRTQSSIDNIKKPLSAYQQSGQLQQRPSPKEGKIFKRHWFSKRWTKLPDKFQRIIDCWDLTFDKDKGSAYNVGYKLGLAQPYIYVLEEVREKMDIIDQLIAIPKLKLQREVLGIPIDMTRKVWVENAANGKAAVKKLKKKIPGIDLVNTKGRSKEDRADAVTPLFQSKNILFPMAAPWVEDAIEEIVTFGPTAAYKDRVDALVHGVERLEKIMETSLAEVDSFEKLSEWAIGN